MDDKAAASADDGTAGRTPPTTIETPGQAPQVTPTRRPSHWLRNSLLGLVLLLVAVILFAQFALPGIVRTQAERLGGQALHRKLTIANVEVHPLSLAFALQGVQLMEPDGKTVFASFDRFDARVSPASLLHLAPVVRELHLAGPYVHWVRLGPNQYSTDDIAAALAEANKSQPPAAPSAAPPRFAVHNIQIDGGRFEFDDVPNHAHHSVKDFALGVPFVSTFPTEEEIYVEPLLRALIDGSSLELKGQTRPFAPVPEATIEIKIDDIDLTRYIEYLPKDAGVRLSSGHLALNLQVAAQMPKDQAPKIKLAGTIGLKALEVATPQTSTPIQLAALELAIAQAEFPAGHLDTNLTIAGKSGKGRVSLVGETSVTPLHADLALSVDDLDLLALQPFFADRVNLRITRVSLAGKGRLKIDQHEGGPLLAEFQGDIGLPKLATIDALNANDFVDWDLLALRGVHVRLEPFSLQIDQVALDNVYARVIVNPNGRINLQDIGKTKAEAGRSLTEINAAAAAESSSGAAAGAPTADAADAGAAAQEAPPTNAPIKGAAAGPPLPPVTIGKILITGGHVRFSDNFIKPKYTADLLDLHGNVSGLSSHVGSAADVDLHGKVNGAPLLITGKINPLLREPALNIKGSVHDMELAGLSPYSGKYVGYNIERGKLSFEADYQLENRALHAENHLVLDQLTFGDKVDSPSATSLPVRLAISLLKDRNGVIDINLPIGGSLDDPQFSVGRLILKVLVNLITKAVTAPFALLGNLFGGGEELSSIDFAPGQALVAPAAEAKLKSLSKALEQRPGLKLDISGRVDPTVDREALQRVKLDGLLRALKRKDLAARGALVNSAEVTVGADEYPTWLARAYQADVSAVPATGAPEKVAGGGADVAAAKPGAPQAKTPAPSQQEMEDVLRSHQTVSEDDLLALGNQRAQAAKDWLQTTGQVAEDRLSLVAAKISETKDATPAAHGSGVEFALH
jgi:hypothetical protein